MGINKLITRADIPNITTMLGNLGRSWNNPIPNDLYIKGIPKIIFHDQSDTKLTNGGNVGGGLDTLFTFSLPANCLKSDGDILEFWFSGNFAANDNDKRLVSSFAGTAIEDTGLFDIDVNVGWTFDQRISRVSSTAVITSSALEANVIAIDSANTATSGGQSGYFTGRNKSITGLPNLNSNTSAIELKAEGTANDDIVINQVIIKLTRF